MNEDRPDEREGSMGVREARGEDSGKGEGVDRPQQQEEESQVRCHIHVIA